MELIDYSPIKPMLMRSLENPEAIKVFINYHLWILASFGLKLLWIFIIWSLLYLAYLLWENKGEKSKKEIIKKSVFEYFKKVKKPLRRLRYLIIWTILMACAWLLVSSIFYIYTRASGVYNCSFSPEENLILGYWAFLSLIIFLIAPVFIMFCFGNKFIRNIWILIYIFWIWFIAMWRFMSIGCVWMEYEEETEEVESIENFGGIQEIEEIEDLEYIDDKEFWGLRTDDWNDYKLLPDSAEISVKDTIIEWEAVNFKVTIIKNWSVMTSYDGDIRILITDENWNKLKDNEYILPNRWIYSFLPSDLWEKEFQRWLEIYKEWTFYIEIQDLNENEDKIFWRQKVVVTREQ